MHLHFFHCFPCCEIVWKKAFTCFCKCFHTRVWMCACSCVCMSAYAFYVCTRYIMPLYVKRLELILQHFKLGAINCKITSHTHTLTFICKSILVVVIAFKRLSFSRYSLAFLLVRVCAFVRLSVALAICLCA